MNFKSELEAYRFIMDIETYVLESTQVPFTNKVIVDKDVMYDFLDRLRSRLPREMKECKRIIEQKQKEENKRKNEHNHPMNNDYQPALEQNIKLIDEKIRTLAEVEALNITKKIEETQIQCETMIKDAEKQAQEIIRSAHDYAEQIVERLQSGIEQQILEIKDGRSQIANVLKKIKQG